MKMKITFNKEYANISVRSLGVNLLLPFPSRSARVPAMLDPWRH
jgi:hypothetical protein